MFNPSDSSMQTHDWRSQIIPSIHSYDGKVMLAAIISLSFVILFVLLLHAYSRWLQAQAHQQRRRSVPISHVLSTTRSYQFDTLAYDETYLGCPKNGLDASVISSLPLFVYKSDEYKPGLECIICLSMFEDDEMGRKLPKCQHAFHVECIDMWLQSHSSCPICRAPVGSEKMIGVASIAVDVLPPEESRDSATLIMGELDVFDGNSTSNISIQLSIDPDSESKTIHNYSPPSPPPSSPSSSSSSSSSLGCSLKRMLSRNKSERKVFPSSNVNELNV